MYIYCGHGDGSVLFDHYLLRKETTAAAALLWGCNSGRMVAHGVHDPSGASLSHLLGGAPFLLGNLWEVTDQDIDLLTVECLTRLLEPLQQQQHQQQSAGGDHRTDACAALIASRDVCKKSHAVGCSPVVYGLPVLLRSASSADCSVRALER